MDSLVVHSVVLLGGARDLNEARRFFRAANPEVEMVGKTGYVGKRALYGGLAGIILGGTLEASGAGPAIREFVGSSVDKAGDALGAWIGIDSVRADIGAVRVDVGNAQDAIAALDARTGRVEGTLRDLATLPEDMRSEFDRLWSAIRRGDTNISAQLDSIRAGLVGLNRNAGIDFDMIMERLEGLEQGMQNMTRGERIIIERWIEQYFYYDTPAPDLYGPIVTGEQLGAPNINKAISTLLDEAGVRLTGNGRGVLIDAVVRHATENMNEVVGPNVTNWRAVPNGTIMDLRFLLSPDSMESISILLENERLYRMPEDMRTGLLEKLAQLGDALSRGGIDLTIETTPSR